jgi:hypothetical protein
LGWQNGRHARYVAVFFEVPTNILQDTLKYVARRIDLPLELRRKTQKSRYAIVLWGTRER